MRPKRVELLRGARAREREKKQVTEDHKSTVSNQMPTRGAEEEETTTSHEDDGSSAHDLVAKSNVDPC